MKLYSICRHGRRKAVQCSYKWWTICGTDVFITSDTPYGPACKPLNPRPLHWEVDATPVYVEWHSIFVNAHYWWDKKLPKPPLGWWDHPWGQIQRGHSQPPPPRRRCSVDAATTCIFKRSRPTSHTALSSCLQALWWKHVADSNLNILINSCLCHHCSSACAHLMHQNPTLEAL